MNEASCQTIRILLDALHERNVDITPILERFSLSLEKVSDPSQWVDWNFYLALLNAVEKAYPNPGEIEAIGARLLDYPSFDVVWKLSGFFVSPYHLYSMGSRWIGNRYFRNVRYGCRQEADGRILFEVSVPENYRITQAFFHLHAGTLAAGTRVLGLNEPASVESKITSHRGEFWITVPASRSWLRKLRGLFPSSEAGHAAVEELAQQQAELLKSFQELTAAHDTLREREKYFRSVVENVSDVVVLFNLQGEVQYISPSIELLSGYSPEEAARILDTTQLSNADAQRMRDLIKTAIEVPGIHQISNLRVRHKDGSRRVIDVAAKRFHSVGDGDLILTSTRDVTERYEVEQALHQSEERLAQAQKLEAIGALAGGVAHDFNNLLQVVKNATEALREMIANQPEARAEVDDIERAVEHGIDLTRQLTAFTRRQMLPSQVLDLNHIVHDMAKMLQRLIGEKIRLVVSTSETPVHVETNVGQIGQVILNLVLNGRDAMPDGGSIAVEVDSVSVTPGSAPNRQGVKPGDYAVLIVSDTGCGMSPEVREKIFDPFFTTNPTDHSTGVGLTTVQDIVQHHGGYIIVDTEERTGTTMLAYFPLAQGQSTAAQAPAQPAAPVQRGTETILVADDDERVRTQICDALRRQGYQTLAVGNADDAIEVARTFRGPIHLFITDLVLPDTSGLELTKHISGFFPEIKVLFISGYTNETFIRSSWLDPTFDLLPKPFSIHELLRKTREILDEPVASERR